MMSLPFAYSKEYGDIISPDDAYDLYWEGKLSDQHEFICLGTNCNAQVTLVNMYKEEFELRQTPHYRCRNHKFNCEYVQSLLESSSNNRNSSTTNSDYKIDVFFSQRPKANTEHKPYDVKAMINNDKDLKKKYEKYTGKPKFFSIRPIVDRYFIHREEGDSETTEIKVDGKNYTYKTFFKGIYNQDVNNLLDHFHIYWGIAYINRLRDETGYRIVYQNIMYYDKKKIRPSVIIKDSVYKNYFSQRRFNKYLNLDAARDRRQYLCFVYANPTLNETSSNTYINFKIESLDLIDFKEIEYLNKLRSNDILL